MSFYFRIRQVNRSFAICLCNWIIIHVPPSFWKIIVPMTPRLSPQHRHHLAI